MHIELLITQIEKRPFLIWGVSDELYKDRNKKNDEWMSVATVLFENCHNTTQVERKFKSKYINYAQK